VIFKIVRTALLSAFIGGAALAVGYARTDVPIEIAETDFEAPWEDAAMPEDYSASKDRIEFELAALSLFGPAQSAAGMQDADGLPPEVLRLVAIANLDGTMFALVDEGKPVRQKLKRGQKTENGWMIEEISQNEVAVSRASERKALKLFGD
jgi:hypothetical protein